MDKIAPISISLHRLEGTPRETQGAHEVTNWRAANALLSRWSDTAPRGGSYYDKVNFCVRFADGSRYEGRFDLKHWSVCQPRLDEHVRDFCLYMTGARRPKHRTAAQYAADLATYPAQILKRYGEYVQRYSLNAYENDSLA